MKNILILSILLIFAFQGFGQQVEKSKSGLFLLQGGTIHTITNGTINGDILIKDGLIAEINDNIIHPEARVIDCKGLSIYPGLIDAGTKLGLAEIGAVSLTQDHDELGDFTPHMDALTAVNPTSVSIPVTRVNGITTVLTVPSRGLFPGTAALINLHGYTPEQMYAGFKGVVMNFPSTGRRSRRDRRSDEDIKKAEEKALKSLTDFWDKAVLNAEIHKKMNGQTNPDKKYTPQLDAMVPVINNEAPLLVEVNQEKDILKALDWIKEKKINAIFTGVAEGHRVADSLAKYNIPVITGPILSTPRRNSDKYDTPYASAGLMQKAGVKVAIRTNESENVRNLPYNAGFAATYGMGVEEALKAITIVPAEILGVADKYGSIERGKVANIFITDGDPFETKTQVRHLFINGWQIPLESRHSLLHEEFLQRSPGLK